MMTDRRKRDKRKRCSGVWLFEGMLTLGVIVGLSVLLMEIGVRILHPEPEVVRWLTPHPRYGHVLKKNFHQTYTYHRPYYRVEVDTNALAMRDAMPEPKAPNQKTVLFLGDSFAFGYGVNVEDRFDEVLEELLVGETHPFRFINAGVDGWGTQQQVLYAQDHFEALQPDIIVLTFCQNDPYDDALFSQHGVNYAPKSFPGKEWVRTHSHLFRFVRNLFWMRHRIQSAESFIVQAGLCPELLEQIAQTQSHQEDILIPEIFWKASLKTLRDFHEEFRKFNPKGLLLIQATAPVSADIRKNLQNLDNGDSLRYVDLYDAMASLTPEARVLPHDPHWSLEVHRRVAKHLKGVLLGML